MRYRGKITRWRKPRGNGTIALDDPCGVFIGFNKRECNFEPYQYAPVIFEIGHTADGKHRAERIELDDEELRWRAAQ
jgi:hypothetical protein